MPRLRVVAGPSLDTLVPISVNSDESHSIISDAFHGRIAVHIKDFMDKQGSVLQSEYFDREDRKGITWSIQVQGRFLHPISADDVLFGNTFDRPLKLPWGSGAALKFMHFIDPTLEHDLMSATKPWALSPLISTMPHFAHKRVPSISHQPSSVACHLTSPHNEPPSSEQEIKHDGWPDFPPPQSLSDDTAQLHLTLQSPPSSHSASPSPSPSPSPCSLSRQPSSGGVTPESGCSATTSVTTSPDLSVAPQEASSLAERQHNKKKNRLSAGSLVASLLPVNQDGERRRARRERKRTEKLARHEQTLQELRTADRRRAYFRDASHRRELVFGPEDVFTMDFCYGFIQFAPTLSLNLPGGISFDLMHYWDGQPVRFMCCERKREAGIGGEEGGVDDVPWGRVLWCVAIEHEDEEGSQPMPQKQTVVEDGVLQDNLTDDID